MPSRRALSPALRVTLITLGAFGIGAAVASTLGGGGHSTAVATTSTASATVPATVTPLAPVTLPLPTTIPPAPPSPVTDASTLPPVTVVDTASTAPGVPAVDAKAYVVFDADRGVEVAASNADAPLPVGSLMKLLTDYVVLQAGEPDKVVTVPAMQIEEKESQIGLYAGEQLSRAVLVRAMLIVSANDAARALAVDVAGSLDAFVAQMNAAASSLGLHDTVAMNPIGLDADGQHSTAHDVLTLARTMMAEDAFRSTVARSTASLHGMTYNSPNDFLTAYPGANGIKTGHTTDAGYCLAASATRDGRTFYAVVLGAPSKQARLQAAAGLLDWAFAQP